VRVPRRVFVSYSHDNRAWRDAFRQMLGPALAMFDVELWADDHVRSGDDWERAIDGAVADAELALLLVTPAHLDSSFIWETEVPALVAGGVPVVWALVEECLWEHNPLLARAQGLQDPARDGALADHLRPTTELARLCRKICEEHLVGPSAPSEALDEPVVAAPAAGARLSPRAPGRVYGAVPERPPSFVPRGDDHAQLRAKLVDGLVAAVGVIGAASPLGVHGRGGIGKTVLAAELTRDPETLAYFPGGVFWLTVGERPDLVETQRRLATWLGGDPEVIRSPLQGAKLVRELVGDRQCLLVLDDVWSVGAAQALAATGPHGRVLLTTRDRLLLERLGATIVPLDVLDPDEARQLLGALTTTAPSEFPVEAEGMLEATGRVALAVALVGAAVGRGGQSWASAAARLAWAGQIFADHPYADVFKALEVATASLGAAELARYQALACFPEDTVVPTATIGRLWGLVEPALGDQLRRFGELRLARLEGDGLVFHDLERDYLLLQADAVALAHEQLLDAHAVTGGWHLLDPAEPYLWDHLTYHLAAAGRHHELIATVADPAWLAIRIARGGSLAAEQDVGDGLRWEPGEPRLHDLLQRLQQTGHLLDRARRAGGVAATLGTLLWPLRAIVDLSRLNVEPFGPQPTVAWVADRTSPQLVRTLAPRSIQVRSAVWSPDGSRIAAGGDDGSIRVWDQATGNELRAIAGHRGLVRSVAWSPDGRQLASASDDRTVRLWQASTGAVLWVSAPQLGPVRCVGWSRDGARLASGAGDGSVKIHDATTGAELLPPSGCGRSVWSIAWSPDGSRLAAGVDDGSVRLLDASSGAEENALIGQAGRVRSLAWSPDGSWLASGANDGMVRVWDTTSGTERCAIAGPAGRVGSLAWSPDGTRLASGADDATVRVWDASDGAEVCALFGHFGRVWSVGWSPDGTRLASGATDGTVRLWAVTSVGERRAPPGHANRVRCVAWSPDGSRLATCANDGTVRIWDGATGAELLAFGGHTGFVRSVTWSPDGTRLASCGNDATVRVWQASNGGQLRALSWGTGPLRSVAWSPDGTSLASAANDGTVRLWDAATWANRSALVGHTALVRSVRWSPDGTLLASAGNDGTVRVWNTRTGVEVANLSGHFGRVWSVAWSPDGTQLAYGADSCAVLAWMAEGGTDREEVLGHTHRVASVIWTPDGDALASAGYDGTLRVEATGGKTVFNLVAGGSALAVDYSFDGRLALGVDRSVVVYSPRVERRRAWTRTASQ